MVIPRRRLYWSDRVGLTQRCIIMPIPKKPLGDLGIELPVLGFGGVIICADEVRHSPCSCRRCLPSASTVQGSCAASHCSHASHPQPCPAGWHRLGPRSSRTRRTAGSLYRVL